VIVRPPTDAFRRALSEHPDRYAIDPTQALRQHRSFIQALARAGVEVVTLAPEPDLPDAPFVSDTLLALPPTDDPFGPTALLVATRSGAPSRRPEVRSVESCARTLVAPGTSVRRVRAPGTLDGGDVLVLGDRLAIGLSSRTNRQGAEQLARLARALGYRVFLCPVKGRLHLASEVTALGPGRLVGTAAGFASLDVAARLAMPRAEVDRVLVPDDEAAAANVLAIGGRAFVAAGNPRTAAALRASGERVAEVELDQFTRADGGPTCLVAVVP
jgi:dimethylargininase